MATAMREASAIHHEGNTPGGEPRAAIVESPNRRLADAIDLDTLRWLVEAHAGDLT